MFFGSDDKPVSIVDAINSLPDSGVTIYALKALDFVVPGEWNNPTDFDALMRDVTGETDEEFLGEIKTKAIELYNDDSQGYQTAIKIFKMVDTADTALGAAAIADKIADSVGFLSFMKDLTPKADTVQSIDLAIKITAELLAFTKINGIPGDSFGDFVGALGNYAGESKMRMAGIVAFDGVLPLGPDFAELVMGKLQSLSVDKVEDNVVFKKMAQYIPGSGATDKLDFVKKAFEHTKGWVSNFQSENNINSEKIITNLSEYISLADTKLDYVAAFLDTSTSYFEHTGTQTVASRLIERAVNEI
ncbi:hypothetical protein Fleli_2605 [Bernardetia litoralis DSM 6794]|uniref:Uncharacterized protein n=1 Tax=Bernardetia litoralis (strain ATCC 23117 / DSM 6794 / NBRC 15988 / NCIMB 1366 / Fx l1 / Sio-4) TaxID=880071 RepID=I4ALY3_BERLS|nr:hypothetical protein [Bernardetia litoralis]AFM04968.1 hypothetical protein Fleli_2605 [Bernardetia litoralis DSM 6794]